MSELLIPEVSYTSGSISFDKTALLKAVDSVLRLYEGHTYTSRDIAQAKADRAFLNNQIKELDKKRIEVKKDYSVPLTTFEQSINEITGKIKCVRDQIDSAIENFELVEKQKKMLAINQAWAKTEYGSIIPCEMVFKGDWLNKSYSENAWKEDMEIATHKIESDIATINLIESKEKHDWILARYLSCLDIKKSISDYDEFQNQKKKAKSLPKEKQEEEWSDGEQLVYCTFRVACTREQLADLSNFMNTHGIDYEKVE
jgi:hypothetical protein